MKQPYSNEPFLRIAKDEKFWKALNPDLHISPRPLQDATPSPWLDAAVNGRCVASLLKDGYFHAPPLVPRETATRLSHVLTELETRNIPVVFAFVYDEFWQLFFSAHRLMGSMLGPDYELTPSEIWAFHVPRGQSHAGWKPHRDLPVPGMVRENNVPAAINMWIPLTDTTPLNGCMHVLPESLDFNLQWGNMKAEVKLETLQDVRALPAAAGSVLGWNTRVLHWGGRSSDQAEQPRIAVALYVQARDLDLDQASGGSDNGRAPRTFRPLTFDKAMELPFAERLRAIGEAILRYSGRHPVDLRGLGRFMMGTASAEEMVVPAATCVAA